MIIIFLEDRMAKMPGPVEEGNDIDICRRAQCKSNRICNCKL